MSTTPNLSLPLLEPNQDQPHVPINQAFNILDAVIGEVDSGGMGGGGSLVVVGNDDSSVVPDVTQLNFVGAVVTDEGGGVATVTIDDTGGDPTEIDLGMFFPGTPISLQLMFKFVASRPFTFPANFTNAVGDIGTNPTSTFLMTVAVSGVTAGTISVSTGGVFTFATTGAAVFPVSAGEVVTITAPSSTDATAANIAATLMADLD